MKITRRCVPLIDRKWLGNCKFCGSEAVASGHEMTNIQPSKAGSALVCSWEKCPVCNEQPQAIGVTGQHINRGMLFFPES